LSAPFIRIGFDLASSQHPNRHGRPSPRLSGLFSFTITVMVMVALVATIHVFLFFIAQGRKTKAKRGSRNKSGMTNEDEADIVDSCW